MSKDWVADVREFHEKHGVPVLIHTKIPSLGRVELREKLIGEECKDELCAVLERIQFTQQGYGNLWEGALTEVADGIADSIVVLIGTALEFGIPLQKVWDEVHRSNMTKEAGNKRDDGKILKGENFSPPDLKSILEE